MQHIIICNAVLIVFSGTLSPPLITANNCVPALHLHTAQSTAKECSVTVVQELLPFCMLCTTAV
eukprot:2938612-Amphidinium_carterae.1